MGLCSGQSTSWRDDLGKVKQGSSPLLLHSQTTGEQNNTEQQERREGDQKFKVQSSKYFICHCHKNNETVEAATDS